MYQRRRATSVRRLSPLTSPQPYPRYDIGLQTRGEFIGELSANANKELAIEQAMTDIALRWQDIEIPIAEYKEVYFKVPLRCDYCLKLSPFP